MNTSNFVKKDWGWENWFANIEEHHANYCGKILFIEHGKWSSNYKYHYHKVKDETFLVLEGQLQLDYIDDYGTPKTAFLNPNQSFRVPPGIKHRFTSTTEFGCKFLEVSTFHSDEDSYRCYYDHTKEDWVEV